MQDPSVLMTFAGGLAAALVLGFIAHRLRLSPIVGYLLAGVVVGPFSPGYVADRAVAQQFADIGVILLLFGIGLRFHLREMAAVWRVAVPGALLQSAFTTGASALLLHALGFTWSSGIVIGLGVSVASTVVLAVVLAERHDLHSQIGHIAIGRTVVEDLLTFTMLLLLPIVFDPHGGAGPGAGAAVGLALVKLAGLVGVVVVLGRWAIPWALEKVAATRSRELFTLAVLVLPLGIAVGAASLFGVSTALGAFLAGVAVGRSEFGCRAATDALPMRDAFAVLFFVSVGMLIDPRVLVEAPRFIAAMLAVVLIGKPVVTMLTVRVMGRPWASAVPVGAAFAQIGEFTFILETAARDLKLIDKIDFDALVAVSIMSIAVNPILYRWARRTSSSARAVTSILPSVRPAIDPRRTILVGYGPVGRIVYRLLAARGAIINVIELNLDTVRHLRAEGIETLYGDVLRPGTLDEAGIATTSSLILSADVEDSAAIVRHARVLNPELRILVRCTHLRDSAALREAGATVVAAGEAEVAVALAEAVMSKDGADQGAMDQERAEIRRRLYERPKAD